MLPPPFPNFCSSTTLHGTTCGVLNMTEISLAASAIVGHGDRAQLRWFLVDPLYRGLGLGRRLLTAAMDFVRQCSEYRSIYLDTTSDLHQAIGLYERLGFQKVKETPNPLWREGLMELEYSMELAPSPAAEQAE